MADIAKTVGIIFEGQDNTGAAIGKIEQSLKGVGTEAAKVAPDLDKAAASTKKLGDAAPSVNQLVGALQALAGSIVVKEFVAANVAVENFGLSMKLITGDSDKAADSLDFVKQISNTLGLEVTSTAQNFVQLAAAAKGTALEGDSTRVIFEAVSKAMALLGKSSADTGGALTAIQQIISKGTVSSEELRGQLGERLPGAFGIAARAIGVTTQELGKLLEGGKIVSSDFLPKFAAELNKTFGDTKFVTTFNAEFNRLTNTLKDIAVIGGDAGLFAGLTNALVELKDKTTATGKEVKLIKDTFDAFNTFRLTGDIDQLGRKLAVAGGAFKDTGVNVDGANQSLAETARLTRLNQDAIEAYADQSAAETARLVRQSNAQNDAIAQTNDLLSKLGVDPKKVIDPLFDMQKALLKLAETGTASGNELFAAFGKGLGAAKTLDDINEVGAALTTAFLNGKIGPELFAKSVEQLGVAQAKILDPLNKTSDAIKKQADEAKRAEDNAAKLMLELEKLASNERIKLIEAKVNLDIANVQANAQKAVAAFESVDNAVTSTGDVLKTLFGLFKDYSNLDWAAIRAIEAQIDKENAFRQQAFDLQKKLTEAQIEALKAQVRQIDKGDALIKVDGAGLQPHLEAFMWEILRAIQVRVNQDGLKLLLGV
jgi:tape measure domain-containing protein